jgi:hypothetical protein
MMFLPKAKYRCDKTFVFSRVPDQNRFGFVSF